MRDSCRRLWSPSEIWLRSSGGSLCCLVRHWVARPAAWACLGCRTRTRPGTMARRALWKRLKPVYAGRYRGRYSVQSRPQKTSTCHVRRPRHAWGRRPKRWQTGSVRRASPSHRSRRAVTFGTLSLCWTGMTLSAGAFRCTPIRNRPRSSRRRGGVQVALGEDREALDEKLGFWLHCSPSVGQLSGFRGLARNAR